MTVFDGVNPHIAGGRRGEFNQRFGQPSNTEKRSAGCMFPFTDRVQTDPDTGATDGLLSRLAESGGMPKVLLTNSSSEYWRGDGSLVHTDVLGSRDASTLDTVRIYHFAGTQHASGIYPPTGRDPRGRISRPTAVQLYRLHTVASSRPGEPGPVGDVGYRASGLLSCVAGRWHGRRARRNQRPLHRDTRRRVSGPSSPPLQAGLRAGCGKGSPLHGPGSGGGRVPGAGFGRRRGRQRGCRGSPSRRGGAPGYQHRLEPETPGHRRLRPDNGHPWAVRLHHTLPGNRGGSEVEWRPPEVHRGTLRFQGEYLGRVRGAAGELVARRFLLEEDVEEVVRQAGDRYELFMGHGAA